MTADGAAGDLDRFLQRLQSSSQSRAVLIETATLGPQAGGTDSGTVTDGMNLNLTLMAFVAPPAGSGTPTVITR